MSFIKKLSCYVLTTLILVGGYNVALDSLTALNEHQKKLALGGELEIADWERIPADVISLLQSYNANISNVAETSLTAETNELRANVSLKGVDSRYPVYGNLQLKLGKRTNPFFVYKDDKFFGAALDANALKTMRLKIGDIFAIGDSRFEVTAAIISEPDHATGAMAKLPRIIVNAGAFADVVSLEGRTKRVIFRCRATFPKTQNIDEVEEALFNRFEDPLWGLTDWRKASN